MSIERTSNQWIPTDPDSIRAQRQRQSESFELQDGVTIQEEEAFHDREYVHSVPGISQAMQRAARSAVLTTVKIGSDGSGTLVGYNKVGEDTYDVFIVTSQHAVSGAADGKITVVMPHGGSTLGVVVDENTDYNNFENAVGSDLALVKVNMSSPTPPYVARLDTVSPISNQTNVILSGYTDEKSFRSVWVPRTPNLALRSAKVGAVLSPGNQAQESNLVGNHSIGFDQTLGSQVSGGGAYNENGELIAIRTQSGQRDHTPLMSRDGSEIPYDASTQEWGVSAATILEYLRGHGISQYAD